MMPPYLCCPVKEAIKWMFVYSSEVKLRVPTHLEHLKNSWNFDNLENSMIFIFDLDFLT